MTRLVANGRFPIDLATCMDGVHWNAEQRTKEFLALTYAVEAFAETEIAERDRAPHEWAW